MSSELADGWTLGSRPRESFVAFLTRSTTPPRFVTLVLLCGLSILALNMFLPSLAHIAAEFEADYAIVNLSLAGYAAVTAVLQLLMGPLSDRYGRRPVILAGLVIFCLASLGCLLSENVWVFLFFRMLQGAIVAGYAVSLAVVRDTTDAGEAASRILAWSEAASCFQRGLALLNQGTWH